MDNKQIGLFIAEQRKKKKLSQKQLAEKINVTDKAVSRWETGKGMPEISLLQPLAKELGISVSELLNGKLIEQNNALHAADEIIVKSLKKSNDKSKIVFALAAVVLFLITVIILIIGAYLNFRFSELLKQTFDFKYINIEIVISGVIFILLGFLTAVLSTKQNRNIKVRILDFVFIIVPALLMLFSWFILTGTSSARLLPTFLVDNIQYLIEGGGLILGCMLFVRIREIINNRKQK